MSSLSATRAVTLAVALLSVLGGSPLPLGAEGVPVRFREGLVHGFLVLREQGKVIANGDLVQVAKGNRVMSRLRFRFKDGSIHEETTVFTQSREFRLLSSHLVQKGRAFSQPLEMSIDAVKRIAVVRFRDEDGELHVESEQLSDTADLANGLILVLLKNVGPGSLPESLSLVAATPKPKRVKLKIESAGTQRFSTGNVRRTARSYVVRVDLGGISGLVAPILGKQPPDSHVWILEGEAPAFMMSEQPLYVGGPLWRIELVSPVRLP